VKIFKITLILTTLLSLSSKAELSSSWTSVYQKSASKIPVIVSSGAICSGALIQQDIVVTAAHCVDRMRQVFVYFKNQQRIKAQILIFSRGMDLALIKLDSKPGLDPLPLQAFDERSFEGTTIATIGHPVGQSNFKIQSILKSEYTHVMSSGIISRVTDDGFVSDMSVSPGNSGGPVFNSKGEIIGVVSKKRIDRFVGQLNYVTSSNSIHQLLEHLKQHGPQTLSAVQASTDFDLYLLYATPTFRKNNDGDAKSYLNVGAAVDFWDRLRVFADTNLDNQEVFTEYGIGWNFYIQGNDPVQFYRIIPSIENLRFQWKVNGDQVEKRALALGIMLRASWFPFFVKYNQYQIHGKSFSTFGLGIGF
jgi:hypothetical protein